MKRIPTSWNGVIEERQIFVATNVHPQMITQKRRSTRMEIKEGSRTSWEAAAL
jgi:hypothetical protein